jgi:AraC family transcriptional regulator
MRGAEEPIMLAQTELRLANYPPCLAMAPHSHDTISMNIVVRGDFVERIGRGERHYARGHVALFPPGMTHSQQFGAAGARQIIFRPAESWLDYLADCRTNADSAPHYAAPAFRILGDRLIGEMQNEDGASSLAREAILLEILAAFGRTGTRASARPKIPVWLRAARDFLHENASEPLTLKEIAVAAGRHEIHLAREFCRYYGMPVGAYLRRIRLENAAHLLLERHESISTIALDCGFASHSHLCREFRAAFGVTPSEYRLQNG